MSVLTSCATREFITERRATPSGFVFASVSLSLFVDFDALQNAKSKFSLREK
jgi:hypothetical protein